jgi:hypothetical protein
VISFSRLFYEEESRNYQDTSPEGIISRSHLFDIDTFISTRENTFWGNIDWKNGEDFEEEEIDEAIKNILGAIKSVLILPPKRQNSRKLSRKSSRAIQQTSK